MEKSGSSADVGTETQRHSLWSAAELAAMKLPGMPTSARAWYKLVERDKWPEKLVPGRGGRDGGKVRKYAPPPEVLALIEAKQRGEFVQAKGRVNPVRTVPVTGQIGARLLQLRGEMSRKEFANLLDIDAEDLAALEEGRELPKAWLLVQLKEVLGVNAIWLTSGIGEPRDSLKSYSGREQEGLRGRVITSLLAAVLTATDRVAESRGLALSDRERIDIALAAYGIADTGKTEADDAVLARLAADDVKGVVEFVLSVKALNSPPPNLPKLV